jgi:AAA domain
MPAHTSSAAAVPPPPEPGAPIVEVVRYYTETARSAVPGWDVELIPIAGKDPGVGGLAWQSHASSEPTAVLEHLRSLGPKIKRVDGLGALMNHHLAFDVDHPEHLPADLGDLLAGGLINSTRAGRRHHIFRVPAGRRVGGRKDLINATFPSSGSWGELKAWNGQIRIWSPNADGTHVRLLPGPIPELPAPLVPLLLEPEFYFGDAMSGAMLDDWLDGHTTEMRPDWLDVDVARLGESGAGAKNERLVPRVWNCCINLAADAYSGRRAYEALHTAWVDLCVSEADYIPDGPGSHERKFRSLWERCAGKVTVDPKALADVEAKRLIVHGGMGPPLDPSNPEDADFIAWIGDWAEREGSRRPMVGVDEDLSPVEVAAMLAAVDEDSEMPVAVLPPVVDLHARMEARLARLETGVPPVPDVPAVGTPVAPPERDDENSRSSLSTSEVPGGPHGPEGPEGPNGASEPFALPSEASALVGTSAGDPELTPYQRVVASIVETKGEKIRDERDKLLIREAAAEWIKQNRDTAKLPTLHRRRPEWTKVPPPDGLLRTDGVGLLYNTKKTTHALIGGKGSGKSTLGAVAACEWMRNGSTVIWIDFEVGIDNVYNQFLTVRGDPDLLEERLVVIAMGAEAGGLDGVTRAIEADGIVPGLICLDSVARAIARSGLSENDAEAFITLVDSFADRMRDRGSSVLVIDHFGHEDKTRGRGTSTKGDQIDVELTVEVLRGWSRLSAGSTRLTCRKDRRGYMVPDSAVAVVEYTPDLSVADLERRPLDVVIHPPSSMPAALAVSAGATADVESVRAVVLDILTEEGIGSEMSVTAIDKAVRGRGIRKLASDTLRDALEGLLDDGLLDVRDGPRKSRLWRIADES